jgi:GxxExxY protein
MQDAVLTEKIIGAAFKVHNTLGCGFLEKVYENALALEIRRQGLKAVQQAPIQVVYEGTVVGDYFADLWIEDRVIVEIKAVLKIHPRHEVQLVNYLTATGVDVGLLLNFGRSVEVRRKDRVYQGKSRRDLRDSQD